MDWTRLERALLLAARRSPPSDSVPLAFERRIMARLPRAASIDAWTTWATALWRAAIPCLAIMTLLGVLSFWQVSPGSAASLADEIESTLYADLVDTEVSW